MKKIIIELSDEQHLKMIEHIQKGQKLNFDNETFSGFGINLNSCELGDWLEIHMYGELNLGDVNWKIE
jgi:hypothetical protein